MVDQPRINPQTFSRRPSDAPSVPTAAVPNIRTPSVTEFAASSASDALISMADDAKRLEAAQRGQFDFSTDQFNMMVAEVEEDQTLEAEADFAEAAYAIDAAIQNVRDTSSLHNIPTASLEAYDKVATQFMNKEGLSAFQKKILEENFTRGRIQASGEALKYQANLRKIEQENNRKRIIESYGMQAYNDPSRAAAILGEAKEKLPAKAFEAAKTFITEASLKGMAQTADGAQQMRAMLDDGVFDSVLSVDQKIAYSNMADNTISKAREKRSIESIEQIASFEAQLENDPASFTPDDIAAKVQEFGITSESQVKGYFKTYYDKIAEQKKKHDRKSRVYGVASGEPVFLNPKNPDDVKDVNLVYEEDLAPTFDALYQTGDFSSVNDKKVNFIDKAGVVPSAVNQEVVGKLMSGDATAQMEAIDLIDKVNARFSAQGRTLNIALSADEKAFYDIASPLLKYSPNDPQKAVDLARQTFAQNKATGGVFEKEFDKNFKPDDLVKKITDRLDNSGFNLLDNPKFDVDPVSTATVADMGRSIAKAYYIKNPDMDAAAKYATEQLENITGVWRGDGGGRLMVHSPTLYTEPFDGTHDYLADQLAGDIQAIRPDLKSGEYFLRPDELTTREVQAGKTPSYKVMVITDGGLDELRVDGVAKRYRPRSLTEEEKRARLEAEAAKTKEDLATLQEIREHNEPIFLNLIGTIGTRP